MKPTLEELKEKVISKVAGRLLAWSGDDKVSWMHIAENGMAESSALPDFEKIDAILSDEKGRCSFMIHLLHDGTALVGWNANKNA